ncbi:MAG TPA: protealysin inhibitor emfourin [Thermoanaerobaculaceae bacterium]|nr:protealysin inhibitor emfourin [Thermoanaerobaculaceae bacterium]
MRVRLERSGGLANVRRSVTVDAAALAPERAEELRRLVRAADLATFPENPTPLAGRPDRFIYHLTVEDDAGSRSITVSEDAASDEMQRLLDWVQQAAEG